MGILERIVDSCARIFDGAGDPVELNWISMDGQKLPPTPTVANPRPVPSEPPDWEAKRRAAAAKLGKPFAPDVKTSRVTAPSHMLEHINARAEEAKRERGPIRLATRSAKR